MRGTSQGLACALALSPFAECRGEGEAYLDNNEGLGQFVLTERRTMAGMSRISQELYVLCWLKCLLDPQAQEKLSKRSEFAGDYK